MRQLGVGDKAMILLRRKVNVAGRYVSSRDDTDATTHPNPLIGTGK
jgi:hypothetical protein